MNEFVLELIDNSHMYDITFVVGEGPAQKLFPVHKLVISGSSPIFNHLCFGVPRGGKIKLPNVDPDDFEVLISHIYGKEIVIESIQHAWNLLPTAKKFGLLKLQEICKCHILDYIDVRNACSIYEEADYLEEGDLILETFTFIVVNAKHIFHQKGLVGAHRNTVAAIARQDCIDIESEYQLFTAILEWANVECAVRKLSATPYNLRETVDPLLPHIRFLRMRTFEFTQGPASSGILTKEEIVSILLNLFTPGSSNLPAWCNPSTESRQPNSGFRELSWKNLCACLGSEEESCKDTVTTFKNKDKAIFIVGIGFRLTLTHPPIVHWFSAIVSTKTDDQLATAKSEIRELPVIGEQFVTFDNPVYIKRGETFQIMIKVDDLSPHVHCCQLKAYNEERPFSIVPGEQIRQEGKENSLYVTTCFSTIRYLWIT